MLRPDEDAFGLALRDQFDGRLRGDLLLEVDDGYVAPAMHPREFFLPPQEWPEPERDVVAAVTSGPVLDLGAGAGRHSLHLQDAGYAVTAVDISPAAVHVCRARGIRDARVGDLTTPPDDERWAAVLLMCGNLGLAGGWEETRSLLSSLARTCAPGAVLVADSVDPTRLTDEHSRRHAARNAELGRHVGQVRLRLRYVAATTPWFDLLNVPVDEVASLVADTGWAVERHVVIGADHYVVLRRR